MSLKPVSSRDAELAVRQVALSAPQIPVLVSIPHAGRILPDFIRRAARVGVTDLARLSDSWADLLAAPLVGRGAVAIVARFARAVADCNRHEADMDPVDTMASLRVRFGPPGRKARAGLGVVPARLPGAGALWSRPLAAADMEQRLDLLHRPFHATLGDAIVRMQRRTGAMLLIDLHSMPSLVATRADPAPAQIVIGDRFGGSAAPGLASVMASLAAPDGARVAVNRPYAGGYILERHGQPLRGVHAVQVEFDRRLYLDDAGRPQFEPLWKFGTWLAEAASLALDHIGADGAMPLAAE